MIYRIASFVWKALLIIIFLRPFLSEYVFLTVGLWYIFSLILLSSIYLVFTNKKVIFLSASSFPIFLFVIAILISIIFSGFTSFSLFELYLFVPNILIFYIVSRISPEQQKQLIATVFLAAIIISIYAVYQYFIGFRHTLEYIGQTGFNKYTKELEILSRKRAFATFISPNIFASYIAMMLFFGMGFLITVRQKRKLVFWICIAIFIMIISLLLTKSLGGNLIFVITFLLFLFCVNSYLLPNLGLKKIALRRIDLSTAFILFIFIFISGFFIWHRLPQSFNLNNPNNSMIQRSYYWKASLNMIKNSPLRGVGWRKFGLLYDFYKPFEANTSHYSHNVFLQIMAEMGLLGLLSFLWIVSIFLQTGFRVIKYDNELQGLKIGLFCAACAFLLHNLIDLTFYFGQVSFFWWIILGLFSNKAV